MTKQEVKEKLMDMLVEGCTLSISNAEERIKITAATSNNVDFMKQKAIIDQMVALATQNGYKISLDDIDISKSEGRTNFFQAVFLRPQAHEENK